jgi:hypothetical protein
MFARSTTRAGLSDPGNENTNVAAAGAINALMSVITIARTLLKQ